MKKRHKKAVDFEKCVEMLEKKRMRSAKCVNMTVQHATRNKPARLVPRQDVKK
jgi:hypothetical protein